MEDAIPNEKWFEENQSKIDSILGINREEREFYNELSEDSNELVETKEFEKSITDNSILKNDESLVFDLTSLLRMEFPPISWLVDKLIPDSGLVALSGLPGGGKSWITEHLALAVATGTPLFNKFNTFQGKVLIIDKENNQSLIQKRLKLLGGLEGLDIFFFKKEFLIEDEQLISDLVDFIRSSKIKLLIIDSLIRIYRNKDENSSNDMAEVFRQLKKFQDLGCSVVFTHHHRKQSVMAKNVASESMRGSSDILASVDCHLAVDKLEDGIKITQTKLRQEVAIKPFKIRLEGDEEHLDLVYLGESEEDKEKMEEAKIDIFEVLEEGEVSRADLIDRFKGVYGTKTIDNALKSFTNEEVTLRVGERGKKFYRRAGTEVDGSLFDPDLQNSSTNI